MLNVARPLVLLVFSGMVAASSCASVDEEAADPSQCTGPQCVVGDGGGGDTEIVLNPTPDASGDADGVARSELCGVAGECWPDDSAACSEYMPPGPTDDASIDASGSSEPADATADGEALDGGEDADAIVDGGDADALADAGDGEGAVSDGDAEQVDGSDDADTMQPEPIYSCQVHSTADGPSAQCAQAGEGTSESPCVVSSDCAPGFACVGAGETARCLQYCCGDPEACPSGTYCTERALRDRVDASGDPLRVPVCAVPKPCSLDDPFPCPDDRTCDCEDGKACMVVRSDGTLACVEPGEGEAGEPCPCAAGHICSMATQQCLKICKLGAEDGQCGDGKCQAASELPEGYGVCVGPFTL